MCYPDITVNKYRLTLGLIQDHTIATPLLLHNSKRMWAEDNFKYRVRQITCRRLAFRTGWCKARSGLCTTTSWASALVRVICFLYIIYNYIKTSFFFYNVLYSVARRWLIAVKKYSKYSALGEMCYYRVVFLMCLTFDEFFFDLPKNYQDNFVSCIASFNISVEDSVARGWLEWDSFSAP